MTMEEINENVIIKGADDKQYLRLYHFMPTNYLAKVLLKDEIKVSFPEYCNDPLEFLAAGQNEISKPGGFISFSARCDSSLMWAHYANSHKGVCLEFLFPVLEVKEKYGITSRGKNPTTIACVLSIDNPKQFYALAVSGQQSHIPLMVKVVYRSERPFRSQSYGFTSGPVVFRNNERHFITERHGIAAEYYIKSEEWKYEQEWRLMIENRSVNSMRPAPCYVGGLCKHLNGIILGKKFNEQTEIDKDMIIKCLEANSHFHDGSRPLPNISQAEFDDKEYKIIVKQLQKE